MKTLGMRHIALNVQNVQESKKFYTEVLKMTVEWEPDPDNVYLTSDSQDNLALHKAEQPFSNRDRLDHMGFFVRTIEEVDEWYNHIKRSGAPIVKEIKTHRDGARSFYFKDPDGIVIQLLFHPPIKQ